LEVDHSRDSDSILPFLHESLAYGNRVTVYIVQHGNGVEKAHVGPWWLLIFMRAIPFACTNAFWAVASQKMGGECDMTCDDGVDNTEDEVSWRRDKDSGDPDSNVPIKAELAL
jgi:hypothetical protein